ncbi:MAG: polyprenyl synthetase family protein [Pseudomonadales bacterium]
MTDSFSHFQSSASQRVNQLLEERITALSAPPALIEAMLYSVMNGGKRLRPSMAYAAFALVTAENDYAIKTDEGPFSAVDSAAVALELMHSYSLVHDDLPAMDDDDLRRGKPSCHIAFGEAMAILAGDALQSMAFAQLSDRSRLSDEHIALLLSEFAHAAGPVGMVGGQVLDLQAIDADSVGVINIEQLETIHRAKTGALIQAALTMGAICGSASTATIEHLRQFGQLVGLAFQVVDDVLDITASTEQLGKQQGSDQALGKPTYPALMGLDSAQDYARDLCEQAKQELTELPGNTEILAGLASYIAKRSY